MNREDLLRVGLVLFGVWLVVKGLTSLALFAALDLEWVTPGYALTQVLMFLVPGALLLVGSGRLSRLLLPPSPETAPARRAVGLADLKTVAVALLGLFLVADALPRILEQGFSSLRNPLYPDAHPVGLFFGFQKISDGIQIVIGLALFIGSAPLGRLWARFRDPNLRAPAPHAD